MINNGLSIMIVGVGGQGTLLASRILGNLLVARGYDVKISEVHGMSQRGGSVVTYVKFGDKVQSPIIDKGDADIILAFEELEAYRYLPYLRKGGTIICNSQNIDPMPVIIGAKKYPEDIISKLKEKDINIVSVDADNLAMQAGNIKTVNVVLLGVLSKLTEIDESMWIDSVKDTVPQKVVDVNVKAFEIGRSV